MLSLADCDGCSEVLEGGKSSFSREVLIRQPRSNDKQRDKTHKSARPVYVGSASRIRVEMRMLILDLHVHMDVGTLFMCS